MGFAEVKSRIKRLEKKTEPHMVQIPLHKCRFDDGKEEVLSALDFAYEVAAVGRTGQWGEFVGYRYEPINPCPNRDELNKVFEEIRERMEGEVHV